MLHGCTRVVQGVCCSALDAVHPCRQVARLLVRQGCKICSKPNRRGLASARRRLVRNNQGLCSGGAGSAVTSDVRYLSADEPRGEWKLLLPRTHETE